MQGAGEKLAGDVMLDQDCTKAMEPTELGQQGDGWSNASKLPVDPQAAPDGDASPRWHGR